jgi:hypothetical protein
MTLPTTMTTTQRHKMLKAKVALALYSEFG